MSGNRLRSALVLLLCSLGVTCCPGLLRAQEYTGSLVRWRTDYNQARQEALAKKLPILIDFYRVPCIYCDVLDKTFFSDPKVANLINQYFIPLKVNGAEPPYKSLAEALSVTAFPTLVLAAHDGKVIPPAIIGAQPAAIIYNRFLQVLAATSEPEWMIAGMAAAQKRINAREYPQAIAQLRTIIADGKGRPVQQKAYGLLAQLEEIGQRRLATAQELIERGKPGESLDIVNEAIRNFPDLKVARDASVLLSQIMQSDALRKEVRGKRAQELLAQAQQFYNQKDYFVCVERCATLIKQFGDLPEGLAAFEMSSNIKNDPQWRRNAGEALGEFLADIWLAQANDHVQLGQIEQARQLFDRVLHAFPGTRQGQIAQLRLSQLSGLPGSGMPIMAPGYPSPR